jgi:hypothetical protein
MLTAIYIISIVLVFITIILIVVLFNLKSLRTELTDLRISVAKNKLPEGYLDKEKMINQFLLDQAKDKPVQSNTQLFLTDEVMNFIFDQEKEMYVYLHYTKLEIVANRILETGFQFKESFHKTAINITKDPTLIMHNHLSYKYYGKYIMIICLPVKDVEALYEKLEHTEAKRVVVENLISEKVENTDNEDIYLLPSKYVKGYINYESEEIVANQNYSPEINVDDFIKRQN